jgi:hypothetical protein
MTSPQQSHATSVTCSDISNNSMQPKQPDAANEVSQVAIGPTPAAAALTLGSTEVSDLRFALAVPMDVRLRQESNLLRNLTSSPEDSFHVLYSPLKSTTNPCDYGKTQQALVATTPETSLMSLTEKVKAVEGSALYRTPLSEIGSSSANRLSQAPSSGGSLSGSKLTNTAGTNSSASGADSRARSRSRSRSQSPSTRGESSHIARMKSARERSKSPSGSTASDIRNKRV